MEITINIWIVGLNLIVLGLIYDIYDSINDDVPKEYNKYKWRSIVYQFSFILIAIYQIIKLTK